MRENKRERERERGGGDGFMVSVEYHRGIVLCKEASVHKKTDVPAEIRPVNTLYCEKETAFYECDPFLNLQQTHQGH